MTRPVIIEYDPAWPACFDVLETTIRNAIGKDIVRIDHIGSTSVPGLAAKNIIDLQVTVASLDAADRWPDAIGGFARRDITNDHVPPGGTPGPDWHKRYWTSTDPAGHLHVRQAGRANQRYALLFRDYLRANRTAAVAYERAKQHLAALCGDTDAYAAAKDPICDLIIDAAERWAATTGWAPERSTDAKRQPGQGRYAQLEREQRWLLRAVPPTATDPRMISDHYITGSRLRLRRIDSPDGTLFKFAQKVRLDPASPERAKVTNMYLSQGEYDVIKSLPGARVRKTRWRTTVDGRPVVIDEFLGPLQGLILAEVELRADEPRVPLPAFAHSDVTDDDRFSGGALAHASPAIVAALIAEHDANAGRH